MKLHTFFIIFPHLFMHTHCILHKHNIHENNFKQWIGIQCQKHVCFCLKTKTANSKEWAPTTNTVVCMHSFTHPHTCLFFFIKERTTGKHSFMFYLVLFVCAAFYAITWHVVLLSPIFSNVGLCLHNFISSCSKNKPTLLTYSELSLF